MGYMTFIFDIWVNIGMRYYMAFISNNNVNVGMRYMTFIFDI